MIGDDADETHAVEQALERGGRALSERVLSLGPRHCQQERSRGEQQNAPTAYTASGCTEKSSPPSAGPETFAAWPAIERRASAPASSSVGTISGVSERPAGAPIALAAPVSAASATYGQSWCGALERHDQEQPDDDGLREARGRCDQRSRQPVGQLPGRQGEQHSGRNSARPIRPRSNALRWIA